MKNEFEETFLRKNYLSKGEVKILLKVQVHLWKKAFWEQERMNNDALAQYKVV